MPAYSIPAGYVHKYGCNLGSLTYKEVFGNVWSIRGNDSLRSMCWWLLRELSWWISTYKEISWWSEAHWGKTSSLYDSQGTCVSSTHRGISLVISGSLGKTLFLTSLEGVVLVFWTHEGALDDFILGKTCLFYDSLGSWLMILTHRGVSLSNPLGHAFDLFDPLGMLWESLCFSTY